MTVRPAARARLAVPLRLMASLLAMALLPLLAAPASARTTAGSVSTPGQDAAARLLQRAAEAEAAVSYSGTQYLTAWSPVGSVSSVVHIQHDPSVGTVATVVPSASGAGGEVVTGGAESLQLGPVDSRALSLLLAHYELRVAGPVSCVGRDATEVEARRTGAAQVAARFWVDDMTGLVLRREVFSDAGALLRASVFADLEIDPSTSLSAAQASPVAGTLLDAAARGAMELEGYASPATLPGGLDRFDTRRGEDDGRAVVHATYSDGLSTLSLFSENGRLGTMAGDWSRHNWGDAVVWMHSQAPLQITWQNHGMVYTVVTDGSASQVKQVVAALPHAGPPQRSWWSRLHDGVKRLGSWLNPFD